MAIRDALLPEFDQEMATTRKMLERVPEDKPTWKPHEKSMPMGRLAAHIAELPGWAATSLTMDSFDFAPPGAPPMQPAQMTSRAQLLELFDKSAATARAAIAAAADEEYAKPWSLKRGGHVLFTLPKGAVLRSFALSHVIHHRAQLGVYLRLNNIALPSTYGPSADEGQM
jgi:uncharacterized damage-inducible protein DinB